MEHLEQVFFRYDQALEFLFLFDGHFGDLFEGRVVCVRDGAEWEVSIDRG